MINCLWVGAGGFIGSVFRYLLGLIHIPEKTGFPVMTMLINVTGALLIGVIVGVTKKSGVIDPHIDMFLRVGICGGFTTFSAFALEAASLLSGGKAALGLLYVVLSVVLCVLAVMLGRLAVRA